VTESIDDRPEHAELRRQVARLVKREVEPNTATWDDGVIDPLDTRMTLGSGCRRR
jgi:acetyl-CoA carboxylase carboxyltransferase component